MGHIMVPHNKDEYWMQLALAEARRAKEQGEVPVGAVLVLEDQLIGVGFNQPIRLQDPTAHAEIQALRQGAAYLKNYRLVDTTLYVTLEPCMMCRGAMVHARVKRLVIGALDLRTGGVGLNHKISCEAGILEEACSQELKAFFKERR